MSKETSPDPRMKRPEFLLEMYKQMMADINRHIIVVWQSIGVVLGSFAIMGLAEKKVLPLDFAESLIILVCAWSLATLLDSSYWYNRNLCIISNIERLFLFKEDLKHVHYYFGSHRPKNRMTHTLKIQFAFVSGTGIIVLLYHFANRVWPGFRSPLTSFEPSRCLPYIASAIVVLFLFWFAKKRNATYAEFLKNSPGIDIITEGIVYGEGHGFRRSDGGS